MKPTRQIISKTLRYPKTLLHNFQTTHKLSTYTTKKYLTISKIKKTAYTKVNKRILNNDS